MRVPAQRNGSAPPASGGSETPSLAGMDAANPAAEAASAAASPGAVARERARGFQPATVFENRRPAGLRLALANPALANPTAVGRSHDDGSKSSGRGRLMRADNISPSCPPQDQPSGQHFQECIANPRSPSTSPAGAVPADAAKRAGYT